MSPVLQDLSLGDVAIAAALVAVNGALSFALSLGLGRQLAIAAVRTVVQLLAIGYVLGWVFGHPSWTVVLPLMILMTLVAGFAGAARGERTYAGQRIDSIVSIWAGSWAVGAVGLFVVIRIHPWYEPQYAIPILGMILGNALTGVGLGVERMTGELTARRDRIETALALGATRWEAARDAARQAVRAGMLPTLNQMAVVGIVSLPGMMTGQVLAGQPPAGGALPDRDHVPDRGGLGAGHGRRGAADLPAPVLGRPPLPVLAPGRAQAAQEAALNGASASGRGETRQGLRQAITTRAKTRRANRHGASRFITSVNAAAPGGARHSTHGWIDTVTRVPSLIAMVFAPPRVESETRLTSLTVTGFGHCRVLPSALTEVVPSGALAWKLICTVAMPLASTEGASRTWVCRTIAPFASRGRESASGQPSGIATAPEGGTDFQLKSSVSPERILRVSSEAPKRFESTFTVYWSWPSLPPLALPLIGGAAFAAELARAAAKATAHTATHGIRRLMLSS